jgi:hypothetical protein
VRTSIKIVPVLAIAAALASASAAQAHVLTFTAAKKAAQVRADAYAGKPTRLTLILRRNAHSYRVHAQWEVTNPAGCRGCGYDPATGTFYDKPTTESRSIALRVDCLRRHTRRNRNRPCTPRAYVTEQFG